MTLKEKHLEGMITTTKMHLLHSSSLSTNKYCPYTCQATTSARVEHRILSEGQKSQGFMLLDTRHPTVPAQPPQYGASYALPRKERHTQERDDRVNSKNG